MGKLLQYFHDLLYATTALAKAFERIADCLEHFVEQNKKDVAQQDQALNTIKKFLDHRPPPINSRMNSSLFDDIFGKM